MSSKPAIAFHTQIRIRSKCPATSELDGLTGYVASIGEEPDGDGRYSYGVFVYELSRLWCLREDELEPTGDLDEQAVANFKAQTERLRRKCEEWAKKNGGREWSGGGNR
jgi:hypothetical protein